MPSFHISRRRIKTIVDEEDAWRLKEYRYHLKNVRRVDGTIRQYAYRDVPKKSPDGHILRNESGRIIMKRVFLHKEILEDKLVKERGYGLQQGCMTDHADGDGLNNRRSNLREATNAQTTANQRKQTR